ncbi:MAG: cell division protein FtsZ [Ruminococcaceae bacterium]|nr:cell division protein FtsZ [Oscillospiraceae bacterium]
MTFEHDNACESGVVIRVIGVGGGGNNAVNRMIAANIRGVEFVSVNTDRQALRKSEAPVQMVIGEKITKGFGAGANPDVGARAAEESIDEIKQMLAGADMVFVTAGMGGGTGTGAAPIVARLAHEMNILTIGIVTKPFSFEGKRRQEQAERGIKELRQYVDSLVVIPNEKLKQVSDTRITLGNAFEIADDVLRRGVQSISELINVPGFINLDFADVTSVMKNAGYAHMGVGGATGADKAELAARAAISSPLLETSIHGARGILISITASHDVGLEEVDLASSMVSREAHPDANVIWGLAFDDSLDDEMRITIIATGFEQGEEAEAPSVEAVSAPAPRPEPPVFTAPVTPAGQTPSYASPVAGSVQAPYVAPAVPAQQTPVVQPQAPAAAEIPVAQPVAPAVGHPPKYDSEGEDSSISEDDFDAIMSIFKSRGRRDRSGR